MSVTTSIAEAFLSRDRRLRIRLTHAWFACVLMTCSVFAMHLAAHFDLIDRGPLWWWSGASLAGLLLVIGLIRSGATRNLRDPSLTIPQLSYAVLCAAWAYSFASRAHGCVPIVLTVVLMFGMFGLGMRQIAAMGVYALVLFAVVMAAMVQRDPLVYPPGLELVYFTMMCVMIGGVGLLTMRLGQMRGRLRRQKVELEATLAHIHRLATHDELTGLINRRHMQELLEIERLRSERSAQDWCVALIDLDHFKAVNDLHGHAIGDEALRALSRHTHTLIRKTDVFARWGGEEFVLLLPDTPSALAGNSLDRLREHFHATPLAVHGLQLALSFSAGLTQHVRGETVAQTLARADKLCYQAKERGRNRIEHG
jgi:diguanylate cyclase (GGDEF)-like protein